MKYHHVHVSEKAHAELKKQAEKKGVAIKEVIDELLAKKTSRKS